MRYDFKKTRQNVFADVDLSLVAGRLTKVKCVGEYALETSFDRNVRVKKTTYANNIVLMRTAWRRVST